MKTYFAPPERTGEEALAEEIALVAASPVMTGIMNSVGGLLAILDLHRQVVAVNDSFISALGNANLVDVLGLRLGEMVGCVHSHRMEAGCGTSEYCSTCGAVIAMVTAIESDQPVERTCIVSVARQGEVEDLVLRVRCQPVTVEGRRFLLVFLQDITKEQQKAALERVFYHDISNMLTALVGASDMMAQADERPLVQTINRVSHHLLKEVAIQRCLSQDTIGNYQPSWKKVQLVEIVGGVRDFFNHHSQLYEKTIEYPRNCPDLAIVTDLSLLLRIIGNMLINALEATEMGSAVRFTIRDVKDMVEFRVWNCQAIPRQFALRVFQRNFSTKAREGRGLGTYSMKLFGEKILGGRVWFESEEGCGTTFIVAHPKKRPGQAQE